MGSKVSSKMAAPTARVIQVTLALPVLGFFFSTRHFCCPRCICGTVSFPGTVEGFRVGESFSGDTPPPYPC